METDSRALQQKITELNGRLQRIQTEMNSIQQIGKALSSELRTTRLLPLIMREVTRLMHAERSTFYIVDEERGELWSQIAQKAEIKEIRLKIGVGIAGFVAQTGEVINIEDAYQDKRFDPSTDKKTGYRTRSILCMPIFEPSEKARSERAIIGVLQVLNKIDGVFTKEDEDLLASMASQIAIAIINARLYSALEKKVAELNLLFDIERELNRVYNQEELLNVLIDKITQTLKVQAALIALFDPAAETFTLRAAKNIPPALLNAEAFAPGDPLVTKVVQSREIYVTNRAEDESAFQRSYWAGKLPFTTHHFVCVPLVVDEHVIGIIQIFNKAQPNEFFRKDDLQLVHSLSSQISRSIEAQRLKDEKIKADRLASIGNMMSTIVHDLRTPMNNILGYVELMEEEEEAEVREEFAAIVRQQIKTLTNMTRDVLDFAKGKTNILPVKIAVDKLINNFSKLFENDIKKQGFGFESSCEAIGNVYVDPEKIIRVFMNIMKNALEAMEPGGRFSINALPHNGEIEFRLSDTGSGIPEEIRDKLFDSFVTSGKEGGTGLGLAIVKKIVEQHKGRIEVESETGKGTTFKIYFKKM